MYVYDRVTICGVRVQAGAGASARSPSRRTRANLLRLLLLYSRYRS